MATQAWRFRAGTGVPALGLVVRTRLTAAVVCMPAAVVYLTARRATIRACGGRLQKIFGAVLGGVGDRDNRGAVCPATGELTPDLSGEQLTRLRGRVG